MDDRRLGLEGGVPGDAVSYGRRLEAVRSDTFQLRGVDAAHDLGCDQARHGWGQGHAGVHDSDIGPGHARDWPDDR